MPRIVVSPCLSPTSALLASLALSAVCSTAAWADGPPAPAAAPASTPAGDAELSAEGKESEDDVTGDEEKQKTLQDRIRAVSRRVFLKRQRFELVPNAGLTTNDPFVRAYALGLRGSWHFNEEFALDFGASYVPPFFVQELQDVRLLSGDVDELNPARKGSPTLISTVDGGVTFSPFYGKLALMAEQVLHFDGFISAGLGAVIDSTNSALGVHPALEVGLGTRFFLTRWLTARADLRNYVYPLTTNNNLTFPNVLILSVGVGIHIPFDFDYSSEVIGSKE